MIGTRLTYILHIFGIFWKFLLVELGMPRWTSTNKKVFFGHFWPFLGHFFSLKCFWRICWDVECFFFMEYWNIIKPARNFSEKVTFSRTIFFLMITKLFVCLFLSTRWRVTLFCYYTVFTLSIVIIKIVAPIFFFEFFSLNFFEHANQFIFHHLLILFFVEIVEKLEQSSSWKFFYSKKAHFGTFSQYMAIFLIDDRVAVRWNRFLFFSFFS